VSLVSVGSPVSAEVLARQNKSLTSGFSPNQRSNGPIRAANRAFPSEASPDACAGAAKKCTNGMESDFDARNRDANASTSFSSWPRGRGNSGAVASMLQRTTIPHPASTNARGAAANALALCLLGFVTVASRGRRTCRAWSRSSL